jgi:hypothetical protein
MMDRRTLVALAAGALLLVPIASFRPLAFDSVIE